MRYMLSRMILSGWFRRLLFWERQSIWTASPRLYFLLKDGTGMFATVSLIIHTTLVVSWVMYSERARSQVVHIMWLWVVSPSPEQNQILVDLCHSMQTLTTYIITRWFELIWVQCYSWLRRLTNDGSFLKRLLTSQKSPDEIWQGQTKLSKCSCQQ